ncbi:MAG: serine--tRNA ligase [Oscillospiraceae bacterium]|jgi:seryl-tRNA synthetase|nr:serine--tRNA ligase [Oscillospiraceae bacterium]
MLDINKITSEKKKISKALRKRGIKISFDEVIEKNEKRKNIQVKSDKLRAFRNEVSSKISVLKKEFKDVSDLVTQVKKANIKISEFDLKQKKLEEEVFDFLSRVPNIPDEDVLPGGKENNKVINIYLEKSKFNFKPKNHIEIAKNLELVDYELGAKLSGEGFWVYKNLGARLEWALLNFFIDTHIEDGWEFIMTPHVLNYKCGYVAGQFPKFEHEQYFLDEKEGKNKKFLLPTAETALVNLHVNEILEKNEFPKKYFSYTPCFRRESGASRVEERGTIRGHQFNKVEMVQYVYKGDEERAFREMVKKAEDLIQAIGLHYQVSKLAAKDCSDSMCKTFDIEVFIPSINTYKEVSSISLCRDYQTRRGNTKYRDDTSKKLEFVSTLNASGLATSRLFPALLEQFQLPDGSVEVPEVLRKYMSNIEVIKKKKY